MVKIFEFESYIEYLKAYFKAMANERGIKSKFAAAVGCQNSFLSLVLSEKAHLNGDQAFQAAFFLGLIKEEAAFFELLVERERSFNSTRKEHISLQIAEARARQRKIETRVNPNREVPGVAMAQYYSSWEYVAIHVCVSLHPARTIEQIADYLGLPVVRVKYIINFLHENGLVNIEGLLLTVGSQHVHLPKESPFVSTHHKNWRTKSMLSIENWSQESLHYSVVYSLSLADSEKIKEKILTLIQENMKIVNPSPPEEMFACSIDFFSLASSRNRLFSKS